MANLKQLLRNQRTTVFKSASYYVMHIVVAVSVAYAVTGSWAAAVTLSLLEPTVQVVAYFLHENAWAKVRLQRMRTVVKSATYYVMHIAVAAAVAYAVMGDWVAALTLSLLEPTVQMFFFYFHEKIWDRTLQQKAQQAQQAVQHKVRQIAMVCTSTAGCAMPVHCQARCAMRRAA